jgi:hypothetical protein
VVALSYSLQSNDCGQTKKKDINMLKNMTRKGLALGAGLALVASGLTAAPAQAVATGQLWSAYGQTNEMVGVAGSLFTMRLGTPAGLGSQSLTEAGSSGAITNPRTSAEADTAAVVNLNAANLTADGNNVRQTLANSVSVTWVPTGGKTAPTINITGADAPAPAFAANTVNAVLTTTTTTADVFTKTGTDNTDQISAVVRTTTAVSVGTVVLAAPSSLDYNMQVNVQITYADGSQSEIERVTFVPRADVSATMTVLPVQIGANQLVGGTLELDGINTGNFTASNSTANAAVGQAGAGANDLGFTMTAGFTPDTFSYSAITDRQSFSLANQTVLENTTITVAATFNSLEINAFFVTGATAATASFTVSLAIASAGLEISVPKSSALNQNSSAAATATIAGETVVALEGTKSINFLISSFTNTGRTVASASGVPVTVTLTDTGNGLGTSTITAAGKSLDVSGVSTSFLLTTNSSGQVAFTVTADKAVAGESFTITAETNDAADTADLDVTTVRWAKSSFTLLPAVDGNFVIAPGGSLAVDYVVVDQFGNLAGANYQLAMTRVANSAVAANRDKAAEYASWSYVAPVSATGRASATIVDNGLAATEGSDTVTVSLQKAATAGGAFIAEPNSTNDTFVLTYENDLATLTSTAKVNYNGIANAAGTAVAPILIEPDALVNYDTRLSGSRPTKFDASNFELNGGVVTAANVADGLLRVFGTVVTTGSSPVAGVAVSLSAAGLNFADKSTVATMTRASNDSIVVFTDATGSYEAFVRSATTGNVTIAVNAQGAKSSVEVRFQTSTGVATGLTLAGPSNVASGARGDFVATVVDKFGKPVSGVTVNFKDNGPGVLNVTAGVTTDAFGEAQVTLTTLAAESGTTVVTAFATINGVLVTQTATVVVGKAAATSSDVVVNVGTFSGKLVVYALNAAGSEVSYKIAGKWVTQVPTSDLLQRYDRVVGATGATIKVDIYVDGVLRVAKSVVTK